MKAVPGYGKILTLGSAMTENALVGHVVVQEKIDGSQFSFGMNEDGEVVMRSKGLALTEDNHANMFDEAVQFVVGHTDIIKKVYAPDTYFYCEYLQKPKHNTLKYDRIPTDNLVVFDILQEGRFLPRGTVEHYVAFLGIDVIPELFSGIMQVEDVQKFLETQSYLGGEILEGIVIKNYEQAIFLGGQVFPLFTKYVRESFKERHEADWKVRQPKDSLQSFILGFKSEARWQKAIVHAREKGLVTQSPKDIGPLIKFIQEDIKEEEEQNIKNYLYKCFVDDIMRKSVWGFPEWYKAELLKNLNTNEDAGDNTN